MLSHAAKTKTITKRKFWLSEIFAKKADFEVFRENVGISGTDFDHHQVVRERDFVGRRQPDVDGGRPEGPDRRQDQRFAGSPKVAQS